MSNTQAGLKIVCPMESMDLDNEPQDAIHSSHHKDHQASDMYTRLKGHPRKRVNSVLVRSPWTKLSRRKKKSQVL